MAEQDKERKTEAPSEKRRHKAREDGRTAKSTDFNFAVMLVATAGLSLMFGHRVPDGFRTMLNAALARLPGAATQSNVGLGNEVLGTTLTVVTPFFLAFVALAAAASFMQIGVHFVPGKLRPRPEKLAPQLTPAKFVNGRSLIETVTSILKLMLLAAAAHLAVWPLVPAVLDTGSPEALGGAAGTLVVRLLLYVGFTLVAIGLLDVVLKRRQLEQELKMTKEEVRQEAKDAQGDPEVRGRIRRRQRELALQRMMDEVPKASLVVTNPTHYAVALRYEAGMGAPRVVAKGKDFLALRIRELARAAGVPLVENPPLARALHAAAEPGDEIPAHLYQAVAEILAAVLRTRGRVGRPA